MNDLILFAVRYLTKTVTIICHGFPCQFAVSLLRIVFLWYRAYFSHYFDPGNIYTQFGNHFKDDVSSTLHTGTQREKNNENGVGSSC